MSFYHIQQEIRERVRVAAGELFDINLEQVALEFPPRTELGDLAFPVAFELAKRFKAATGDKQNPRGIAVIRARSKSEDYRRSVVSLVIECFSEPAKICASAAAIQ